MFTFYNMSFCYTVKKIHLTNPHQRELASSPLTENYNCSQCSYCPSLRNITILILQEFVLIFWFSGEILMSCGQE